MEYTATIQTDGTVKVTDENGNLCRTFPNENILADWLPDKDITIVRIIDNKEVIETKEKFLAKYYNRRHPQN